MEHTRKRIRLQNHDYRVGSYFITICTRKRIHFFGEIENGNLVISDIGEYLQGAWEEIPLHFPHVSLDSFVTMPNHIHGILHLDKSIIATTGIQFQNNYFGGPLPGSLSLVIQQFKSVVTKWARNAGHTDFGWQSRFHEHWIRAVKDLQPIRKYINNNPQNWNEDEFY
jgi:REP element-mobilizing transposase RayT